MRLLCEKYGRSGENRKHNNLNSVAGFATTRLGIQYVEHSEGHGDK